MSDVGAAVLLVFLYFPGLMSFVFNGVASRRQHKELNLRRSFITTINSSDDQCAFYMFFV